MRIVIQRVLKAGVTINDRLKASIKNGLLVFCGIETADDIFDIKWLSNKIVNLRIFDDDAKVPNLSLKETSGDILLISQFTLHALTKKGNRPSYLNAAKPEISRPLYEAFIVALQEDIGKDIYTGEFGAAMKVELINDGPVTIWIDSKRRE